MAFIRTWNTAYEAQPADVENISLGASRIRNLKSDIQERGEIDHSWAGDADDGKHKQITLLAPLAADPANIINHGFIYTKDVGGKVELFWEDEDSNVIQLTDAGQIGGAFPATTSMLFYQSAAPVGWTKDTAATLDDHGIRVVGSTAWAGGSKGTDAFSTVFSASKATESHTLTEAEIPVHTHTQRAFNQNSAGTAGAQGSLTSNNRNAGETGSAGSGRGHAHNITMDLNYINVIRATKD